MLSYKRLSLLSLLSLLLDSVFSLPACIAKRHEKSNHHHARHSLRRGRYHHYPTSIQ